MLKLPNWLKDKFEQGDWTVSITGRKFHNVALDEAHEQIINKRLKDLTSRPSEYRTVSLANFMAYLDKFMHLFQSMLFCVSKRKLKPSASNQLNYVHAILMEVKKREIFTSPTPRPLQNIFKPKSPALDNETKHDLLNIHEEGHNRMFSYIRQHILHPPLETPKSKRYPKLRTFSIRKKTATAQKTQMTQVTLLLKRAYAQLQQTGKYIAKTVEYPLALCTEFGEMRDRHKSKFKDTIQKRKCFENIFQPQLPFTLSNDSDVIIDFLKFLHEPTPPDLKTYSDLATYYWKSVIEKLGYHRGAQTVTIVIDKPEYLSPIRSIIHKERKHKLKNTAQEVDKVNITDDGYVPHGTQYTSALQISNFKSKLITYLVNTFTQMALDKCQNTKLIIDYKGKFPLSIFGGKVDNMVDRCNNKGEADSGIWFHAAKSTSKQIIVIANDTDVFMYGIALMESGYLSNKDVAVERCYEREYVSINTAVDCFSSHDSLKSLAQQKISCACMLVLYLLGGSDYISSFFGLTYDRILTTFLKYTDHISPPEDPLVKSHMSDNKVIFESISVSSFTRLMCCIYLEKYEKVYKHVKPTPPSLFHTFQVSGTNMSNELKSLLEWLGYLTEKSPENEAVKITSLPEWTEFTRRVCYFSNHGSKHLYKNILPSDIALKLHVLRGEYVTRLALESAIPLSDHHLNYTNFGWKKNGDEIEVMWDENVEETRKELTRKRKPPVNKCSCRAKENKCGFLGRGCKNCCKDCKPCNDSCSCKGNCHNPHNGGGTCPKCSGNNNDNQTILVEEQSNCVQIDTENSLDSDSENDYLSNSDAESESELVLCNDCPGFSEYFDTEEGFVELPEQTCLESDAMRSSTSDYEDDDEGITNEIVEECEES